MRDWNVIATAADGKFAQALRFLGQFGPVEKTPFYNVIMMRADHVPDLMEVLVNEWQTGEGRLPILNRVLPVTYTFTFQDPRVFERKSADSMLNWAPQLAGKGFHVRMHRRGFKDRLRSVEQEKFLNKTIVEATHRAGHPSYVTFEDPDAIVAVETIGTEAGMSLWFREDLARYPFLGIE